MDLETTTVWYWIIPLLAAALCGIIGYLLGKGASGSIQQAAAMNTLKAENVRLNAALVAARQVSAPASGSWPHIEFDSRKARAVFGRLVKEDDLTLIEGIGPKIEGLFRNFDIKTWKGLSETHVSKCLEVLQSGGDRYKMHDPASWPMQARMAYEGRWKELHKWQEDHKHGKL